MSISGVTFIGIPMVAQRERRERRQRRR